MPTRWPAPISLATSASCRARPSPDSVMAGAAPKVTPVVGSAGTVTCCSAACRLAAVSMERRITVPYSAENGSPDECPRDSMRCITGLSVELPNIQLLVRPPTVTGPEPLTWYCVIWLPDRNTALPEVDIAVNTG